MGVRDQRIARSIGRRGWLAEVATGVLAVGVAGAAPAEARPAWAVPTGGARPDEGGGPPSAGAAVYRVETTVRLPPQNPFGREEADVRAFVLVRGSEAVLVDALTPGNAGLIGEALAAGPGLGRPAPRDSDPRPPRPRRQRGGRAGAGHRRHGVDRGRGGPPGAVAALVPGPGGRR